MKKLFSGFVVSLGLGMFLFSSCHSKQDSMSSYTPPQTQNAPDTMIGAVLAIPVTYQITQQVGDNMKKQQQELVTGWEVWEYETYEGDTIVTVDFLADSNGLQSIKLGLNDTELFNINSAKLSPKADAVLSKVAKNLNNFPETDATIIGYTSHTGPEQFNVKLSKERANAVMNYLISKGVAKNRLKAMGKGWNDPVASNATAKGRAKNRRVEIWVTANQKMLDKMK